MKCANCQMPNPAGAKTCWNCGKPLQAPRAPEGERKIVTILFADVVGSTAIGDQLDPEQVTEMMNGAFALFNAAVDRYGGTVSRLMGDAVLALFGAPVAHEDDAERAVHAGLEIQEAAQRYARMVQETYGMDFRVRVGIHTGLAVLDRVGDEVRTEYTAMGDTANVAARLQTAATPGTVLVSADTYRLVKPLFDAESHGAIEAKGKSAPIETYEIIRAKAVPGTVRGLEGVRSPLVGRDRELHRLLDLISAGATGEGSFVAVTGEAGLGKSRLITELRMRATAAHPQAHWLEGRALSYGQNLAYYPWQHLLRGAIGASDADPPEIVRRKLWDVWQERGLPADDLAFVETVLGVESEDTLNAIGALRPDQIVDGVNGAIRRFITALAAEPPVVLVCDDVHWADEASLELALATANLVKTLPLLMVAIMRPDRSAPGWEMLERVQEKLGERFSEIALEPLPAERSQELLGNLLFVEDLPETVRQLILEKSEGNPFFLEEVIRSLIDSRHIVRENNHWRATTTIVDVAIPDTLAGVLAARIDRLPERTKRVAQTAAVIGRIFPFPVLGATCAMGPPGERIDDPTPDLATLTYEELVREKDRDPELEYIFKHALTQEAAYEALLLRRRKEYHHRVGEAFERLYPNRLDELSPMLAYHYWHAEDWQRAADYAMRAGTVAQNIVALREAREQYERAYEALMKLPDVPCERVIDAVLAWTFAAYTNAPYPVLLERLAEAERLARQIDDKRRLAFVLNWIGNIHILRGVPSDGIQQVMEAERLAAEIGDPLLSITHTFLMTEGLVDQDPRAAIGKLDEIMEMAHESRNYELEAHAMGMKAQALARVGDFSRARQVEAEALDLAERVGSPVKQADVHSAIAHAYIDMDDVETARDHSVAAVELTDRIGAFECRAYAAYTEGLGKVQTHDWQGARELFEGLKVLEDRLGSEWLKNRIAAGLAMARLGAGDAGALEDVKSTLKRANEFDDDYTAGLLNRAIAERLVQDGDLDGADPYLKAALEYYRRADMRPSLSPTLMALAELRERQGRSADADAARKEAREIAQDLALV